MANFINETKNNPIPVTLLSGFLGAGKTTLLLNILRNKENLKCAIIVNDMASLNIDAAIVGKEKILQRKEEMIQMQNGCICCTLRGDLMKEIAGIAKTGDFDYLIIESTGISEPMQVAETFSAPADMLLEDELAQKEGLESLLGIAKLDTCVTVIDSANFFTYMDNTKFLNEELADAKDDDTERTVANLLVEQVEFANVVIVNKVDLISKKTLDKLKGLIRKLNEKAEIITTNHCKVPLTKVLNTGKFDYENANDSPGWMDSLLNGHTPETEEYGISSFIYNAARPFHPERLFILLTKYFFLLETGYEQEVVDEDGENTVLTGEKADSEIDNGVVEEKIDEEANVDEETLRQRRISARIGSHWRGLMRSKGYFWLATRPMQLGNWAQAGTMLTIDCAGVIGSADEEDNNEDISDSTKKDSDRKEENTSLEPAEPQQELVFIGDFIGDENMLLKKDLDSCLLSDSEMDFFKNGNLVIFEDPWEDWPPVEEEDDNHHNHNHNHQKIDENKNKGDHQINAEAKRVKLDQ